MEDRIQDPNVLVIRGYLKKNLSHCIVQEGAYGDGAYHLAVIQEGASPCIVQISAALLSDSHLNSVELRWALKERNIAGQVRSNPVVLLDHETLRMGNTDAIARRPRNSRSAAY